MKRILGWIVVIGILAVVVNDAGRWGQSIIDLHTSTGTVLDQAALTARRDTQQQLADHLAQQAALQKIRVTQFATTPTGLHIWTEEDVSGTWVVGPYLAMSKGVSFQKALSTPFTVSYDAEETLR